MWVIFWIGVMGYFLYKALKDKMFRPMYLLLATTGLCFAFSDYAEMIGKAGTAAERVSDLGGLFWIAAMIFWYVKHKKLGSRIRPFMLWLVAALAFVFLLGLFV